MRRLAGPASPQTASWARRSGAAAATPARLRVVRRTGAPAPAAPRYCPAPPAREPRRPRTPRSTRTASSGAAAFQRDAPERHGAAGLDHDRGVEPLVAPGTNLQVPGPGRDRHIIEHAPDADLTSIDQDLSIGRGGEQPQPPGGGLGAARSGERRVGE